MKPILYLVAFVLLCSLTESKKTCSYDIKDYKDFTEFNRGVTLHIKEGYEVQHMTEGFSSSGWHYYTVIFRREN